MTLNLKNLSILLRAGEKTHYCIKKLHQGILEMREMSKKWLLVIVTGSTLNFTQCVRAGLLVCKLHVYQRLSKYKIKSGIKSTVYIHE